MTVSIERRQFAWLSLALIAATALYLGLEVYEEPTMSALDVVLELVGIIPVILIGVGVCLLFQMIRRQRENQLTLARDLDLARIQGQRWRAEARTLLAGLGDAIDLQFSRWNLTAAEREVALLLLKGLSLKEIATVRASSERTIRAHAQALYAKAGLTGRAALSAFFLEDLLAPLDPHMKTDICSSR
jgi:DNA-binding CsgD family transcriptional regulator